MQEKMSVSQAETCVAIHPNTNFTPYVL